MLPAAAQIVGVARKGGVKVNLPSGKKKKQDSQSLQVSYFQRKIENTFWVRINSGTCPLFCKAAGMKKVDNTH